MDSALNAVFSPNTLVCVHIYLFIFLVKSHLATGLHCCDLLSISLFSIFPKILQFLLFSCKNTGLFSLFSLTLQRWQVFVFVFLSSLIWRHSWRLFLGCRHHFYFIIGLSVFVYFCGHQGSQTSLGSSEVSLYTHSWLRAPEVLVSILWVAAGQGSSSRSTVWLQVDPQHSRQVKIPWIRSNYCMEDLAEIYYCKKKNVWDESYTLIKYQYVFSESKYLKVDLPQI